VERGTDNFVCDKLATLVDYASSHATHSETLERGQKAAVIGACDQPQQMAFQVGRETDSDMDFGFKASEAYATCRTLLTDAGFTDRGILEAVGADDILSVHANDEALLMWRTRCETVLDILIRLFLMNIAVEIEAAGRAVLPMTVEDFAAAGLFQMNSSKVKATVTILPYQGMLFAFDPPKRLGTGSARDYVMGVGKSSITLACHTVRKPCRQVLDLGTGCGFQALFAAQHSRRVLAVDRNPRAMRLAAFNARLNGMEQVECLEGNLFEPVKGQRFDLIVTNPPFVVSPDTRYIYRDSGMPGDQICQRIVEEIPQFLEEGGFAQMLCNWVEPSGQDWRERLATWFAGSGCDAWVMQAERRDVAAYASTWIRHTEAFHPDEHARFFEEWMAYYRELGIEAISAGLITMRRRSTGQNWFRADEAPPKMIGAAGEYVELGFNLTDFLATRPSDSALLETPLRVSPDVRLEQTWAPGEHMMVEEGATLRLSRGLAYVGKVDPLMARLVFHCDGQRPLGELVAEVAEALQTEPETIEAEICSLLRRLIQQGFLLPPQVST
jgi:SAM-dependent methyltransferase